LFCAIGPIIAAIFDCGLPGAAGAAALKLDANKIAETAIRATERVIWSAEARAELFWRFFILFFLAVQADQSVAASTFLPGEIQGQEARNAFHVCELFTERWVQLSRIFSKTRSFFCVF